MRANPFESELERLARTLTEQFGVQVICQGDQAWTDGNRIVIPSVPQPMDEALERTMVGYLDHEMAHAAFSDFGVAVDFERKYPGRLAILNVVEDALIERKAMQRWPGVRRNLDRMFDQIRDRVIQLIRERGPFDRFCTAVYLGLSHHQDMLGLEQELSGFECLLAQFPKVQTTRDAAVLAELLLREWMQRNRTRETESPRQAEPAQHTNRPGCGSGRQEPGKSACGDAGRDSERAESDNQGTRSGSEASSGSDGDSRNTPAERSCDPKCGEDAIANTAGDDAPADFGGAGTDQISTSDNGEDTLDSPTDTITAPAGSGAGGWGQRSLISEALGETISAQVDAIDGTRQYRPYATEHDRLEVVAVAPESEVRALLETGRDTVRRLRRGLTNALRSAEKRWWTHDQLRGDLSPRTLYRLVTDRSQLDVFRKRSVVQGRSTAVSILLDASGSMSSRKMNVARDAMRVLLEALGDLRITTEALTFTTGNAVDISQVIQQTELDAHKLRERYGRLSNLEIGLIKQFDEPVKSALARLPNVRGSGLTPLGEAMQITAGRLAPRPETRRILLVLTDGKAGCEGGGEAATAHAQEMARRITKSGIELIGVGILDDNIREVVVDSIAIQTLEELPAQLCKLLGRTLKKGLKHVG